ncbi:MAG: Arc family DNA-binding protein [Abditibacteriales bacterium]|nr:Arc family DNA-binding protein [Abditibacteriales bacterium]MDW8366337.1 Arc family DNA-binding protein [Abditibacteriales bacterium]
MPQVLIRNVEPDVIDKLKKRARRNGRSFEAELRLLLRQAAEEDISDWRSEVERVRAMFAGRSFSDSAKLLREDRER